MRYVVRALDMKPQCGLYTPEPDEMVAVLDTYDCAVERYKWSQVQRFEQDYGIKDVSGLLADEIMEASIKELLRGRIKLTAGRLLYNNEVLFKTRYCQGGGYEFIDEDERIIFGLNFQLDAPRYKMWFLWAQRIGKLGYRLVLEFMVNGKKKEIASATVFLFLSDEGQLFVENFYFKNYNIVSGSTDSRFRPPSRLRAMLSMGTGVVF